jgi:hypothetical protein
VSLALSLLVNVVVVLAFLWFIHRESERHAAVLAAFAKDAHDREQGLLQRIQAPAAEVVRYHYDREQVDIPPAVRSDDEPGADEDWERARVTKEDILAAMEAERGVNGG